MGVGGLGPLVLEEMDHETMLLTGKETRLLDEASGPGPGFWTRLA